MEFMNVASNLRSSRTNPGMLLEGWLDNAMFRVWGQKREMGFPYMCLDYEALSAYFNSVSKSLFWKV